MIAKGAQMTSNNRDAQPVGGAGYEARAVFILAVGLGLVGLDRFIIMPLFPVMAKDLGLTYKDMGLISASLALTWGFAAIFAGRLADRVGVKTVLVPAALAFSGLVALSGVAAGLGGLLVIRALMGFAEGAFVPACIVAATRASKPSRVGLNVGLLHMSMALFGLGIAPVMATQLLKVLPSWHWVFVIAAVPGLLMAYGIRRILQAGPIEAETAAETVAETGQPLVPAESWRSVMLRPAVAANALAMACWLSAVTIKAAFLPNYLTDHLHLPLDRMGFVLSGLGVGGVIGMLTVPALGDRFGYKRVALASAVLHVGALGLFTVAGLDTAYLFVLLLLSSFAGAGATALTVGPLTSGAVGRPLAATATGIVVGCGEIVGGAVTPILVGSLAVSNGIAIVPVCAMVAVGLGGLILALGVREPVDWGYGRRLEAVP